MELQLYCRQPTASLARRHSLALALVFSTVGVPANGAPVYVNDFSSASAPELSGAGRVVPVRDLEGVGNTGRTFSGNFWWNDSTGNPARRTVLRLTNLPEHSQVTLSFLFAAIESWDGSKLGAPGPDVFNVEIDGVRIFSESFIHHFNMPEGNQQTYLPPAHGLLVSGQNLWGNVYFDTAYDMGLEPSFRNIPHSGDTMEIAWYASGIGWQGGDDESWAIDNLMVSIQEGHPVSEPATLLLLPFAFACRGLVRTASKTARFSQTHWEA